LAVGALGCAGVDVEVDGPVVTGAALECVCHRVRARAAKATATATPTATIQPRDPVGRAYRLAGYSLASYWLASYWLVAGRFAVCD
jgi:hypothetical protein